MEEEETYPPGNMYGILMGMLPFFCDLVGDIMNVNDQVYEKNGDSDKHTKCHIVKCTRIYC